MVEGTQQAGTLDSALDSALESASSAAKALAAQQAFAELGNVSGKAAEGVGFLESKFAAAGKTLDDLTTLTDSQTKQFGVLSAALVGTSEHFRGMGGNVMTIGSQVSDLTAKLTKGQGVIANLIQAGASTELAKSMSGVLSTFSNIGDSVVKGADNALALRASFMSLAASTGDLGAVYASAGDGMENINEVVSNQAMIMGNAAQATNMPIASMENYYAMLGKIPGALTAVVKGGGETSQNLDMLTATMRVAHGTGRDFKEITEDLSVAYTNYGMKGEDALKFTTRFTEISSKFGVQLSSVRTQLTSVASAFRNFANEGEAGNRMAEGAASIMNNYMGALQKTGITGEKASEIIGGMTKHMGELNIAQKSFLSAQTGGPGGLMGGFQIEQMLQKGDVQGVFEKAKETMQKQFGSIMTLEDATKSESAAAQFQKQISMLRQGPLGAFVQNDQDAMRILQGFKTGEKAPTPEKLKDTVLSDTMSKGLDYEKQSATELSTIRSLLEKSELMSGFANLRTLQGGGLTAGKGTPGADTPEAKEARDAISRKMDVAATRGGEVAAKTRDEKGKADATGSVETGIIQTLQDLSGFAKDLPAAVGAVKETLAPIFGGGGQTSIDDIRAKQAEAVAQAAEEKRRLLSIGDTAGAQALDTKMAMFNRTVDSAVAKASASIAKGEDPSKITITPVTGSAPTADPLKRGLVPVLPASPPSAPAAVAKAGTAAPPATAPAAVGSAAAGAAARPAAAPGAAGAPGTAKAPAQPTAIQITGKVDGFCLKCQTNITELMSQLRATATGTNVAQ